MNILTKRGSQDNVVTYEHICDTIEDRQNIENKYITLGTVCIVLNGENGGMEVYMADSSKEWHDIMITGSNGDSNTSGLSIYVCTQNEVQNGKPAVSIPIEGTLYLVPSGNESGNLYDEYIYVNDAWELFGGASIDLTGYATQTWVQQQNYLTSHQDISGKANSADLATVATSGSYNDLSNKPAIPDIRINNTSIVNNGVANIPMANTNYLGTVRIYSTLGITTNENGALSIVAAQPSHIKAGAADYKVLNPTHQHEAVFYGLAKAAGDTTQSQSDNAVGTYTSQAKTAIQNMLGITDNLDEKVDKVAINDAGIKSTTYTTLFGGQFSVTTVSDSTHIKPFKRTSIKGRIGKHYSYRVTFDGTEYILPARLWYESSNYSYKIYEYIGNLGLFISNINGVPGGTDDVPFIIISDFDGETSIDVLTNTAGTYNIKVERITQTKTDLPKSLIYGTEYTPILTSNLEESTYNGFSIGVNELKNKRATIALGYANSIEGSFAVAIGGNNKVGDTGIAIGDSNKATGQNSIAIGLGAVANTQFANAWGYDTLANGQFMTAIGCANSPANLLPTWVANTSYAVGDKVKDPDYGWPYECIVANSDSTFNDSKWDVLPYDGDVAFVIGNGASTSARSNAMKVDWEGNQWNAGKVSIGDVNNPPSPTNANDLTTKQYVDNALAAKVVSVEGTTPAITAVADTQYICGEVSTLSFTPSATGTCDVIFQSGATATVLTIPSTVKFPEWFDASALEANMTYEINITNGTYGAVMSWATA